VIDARRFAALLPGEDEAEGVPRCVMDRGSITVTVGLVGELRRLAGRREIELELPRGATLGSLIRALGEQADPAFARRALTSEGDLQSHVAAFLDGMQVPSPSGMRTELTGGRVDLMLVLMYEGG